MAQKDGVIEAFDPAFDFLAEAGNRDPDRYSSTLASYHQRLWSKVLPGGQPLLLTIRPGDNYLYHSSELGDFCLSSDAGIPTWRFWTRPAIANVVQQVPASEVEQFYRITYEMGGMMVFPCLPVNGEHTINQARGMSQKIADRLDLTLECIRRHYAGETSPLTDALRRYDDFFGLFDDFPGYARFFLLEDLVSADVASVGFFRPFQGFEGSPLPATVEEYLDYRDHAVAFIRARNARMIQAVTT